MLYLTCFILGFLFCGALYYLNDEKLKEEREFYKSKYERQKDIIKELTIDVTLEQEEKEHIKNGVIEMIKKLEDDKNKKDIKKTVKKTGGATDGI